MIVSGFETTIIPTDSPPVVVFEGSSGLTRAVLHEDFLLISFSALLEILFCFGEKTDQFNISRILFVYAGRGVQFEIATLPIFSVVDRPRDFPVADSISQEDIFPSLLLAMESLLAEALAKVRGRDSAQCYVDLGSLVPDFGTKIVRRKGDPSILMCEFFGIVLRWFDKIEKLCPRMRDLKLPEHPMIYSPSFSRYMVFKFCCFNRGRSFERVLQLAQHYDEFGIPPGTGVGVAWLEARVHLEQHAIPTDRQIIEAYAILLSLLRGCYFHPRDYICHIYPVTVDVASPTSLIAFTLSSGSFVCMFVESCPHQAIAADLLFKGIVPSDQAMHYLMDRQSRPFELDIREELPVDCASFSSRMPSRCSSRSSSAAS
jgi:hypothetical protein